MLKPLKITAYLLSSMFTSFLITASLSNVYAQKPDKTDRPERSIDREKIPDREPQARDKSVAGRIMDEKDKPLAGVVVQARTRGCLCSACTGDDKPCKCCIEQRSVTDASGAYLIKLRDREAVDLVIVRDDRVEGRFNGVEASRERMDMRIDREPRDREKPERDKPERDKPERDKP